MFFQMENPHAGAIAMLGVRSAFNDGGDEPGSVRADGFASVKKRRRMQFNPRANKPAEKVHHEKSGRRNEKNAFYVKIPVFWGFHTATAYC